MDDKHDSERLRGFGEYIEISVAMKCNFLKDVEISKISIFVRKHA